jgi:hypothetical protein
MPRYYFNLDAGFASVTDPDGTDLADGTAACDHARAVAREIMAHNEAKTRSWALEVCDCDGQLLFEVPFVTADPSLRNFHPVTRRLIEEACEKRRASARAIRASRAMVSRSRVTVARARRLPWLVVAGDRNG